MLKLILTNISKISGSVPDLPVYFELFFIKNYVQEPSLLATMSS